MNDNDIMSMNGIMELCNSFSKTSQGQLPSAWKRVVSRIKTLNETSDNDNLSDSKFPLGERLASNTRVLDLKNGVLIIESDHSGWIQYIKFYEKFILKGLRLESPDLKITSIAYKLKGTQENQKRIYEQALEKAQKEMEERMARNEDETRKILEQQGGAKAQKNSAKDEDPSQRLPPELRAKFDDLIKSK